MAAPGRDPVDGLAGDAQRVGYVGGPVSGLTGCVDHRQPQLGLGLDHGPGSLAGPQGSDDAAVSGDGRGFCRVPLPDLPKTVTLPVPIKHIGRYRQKGGTARAPAPPDAQKGPL